MKTIDMTPTWSALMPAFMDLLENPKTSEETKQTIREELKKLATGRLEGGAAVPGWHLVPKRAIRKWKADIDISELPIETAKLYKSEPITPAQAEKLLSKADKHLLDDLTEKVSSGLTLAKMLESSDI